MTVVNDINKIPCNSTISIKKVNMTSLLFVDNKVVSKSRYSVLDNYINIEDEAYNTICLYQHKNSSYYYEYKVSLKNPNTVIEGADVYNNTMTHLLEGSILVFVDGFKLLPSQFKIKSNNSLEILNAFMASERSTVIIYTSSSLTYCGVVEDQKDWDPESHSFYLDDYTYLRYLFFKNGEIITRDKIFKLRDIVTVNVDIRPGIDTVSFYRLPFDTENVLFDGYPGYFSYGPEDNSGLRVPEIHDTEVTFDTKVKYAIDDVRFGFFIREANTDGCIMITSNDFETNTAYCTSIVDFSTDTVMPGNYYIQVPEARSIIKYISEYDLGRMLMPEILASFQRLLLDETYDSIQRMKNIRSISKVDSQHIGRLINFLGLNMNLKNLELAKKHEMLEELNNFHRIVGTRESYNFYNTTSTSGKIVKIDQLFTPIKDINIIGDYAERYVDFRTAEELGAVTHREYDYPYHDFGRVDILASPTDSFTNQPRSEGTLRDPQRPIVLGPTRKATRIFGKLNPLDATQILDADNNLIGYIINGFTEENSEEETVKYITDTEGNILGKLDNITNSLVIIEEDIDVELNDYIIRPKAGPNQPINDYGYVSQDATSFYDLGYVYEIIKGKWIEWTTWDRPKNWYPTNHVEVSVQIPPDIEYQTFITEFKNTFYNIASAVLYIHSIIEVYMFGKENPWQTSDADDASGGGASFDMAKTPVYYGLEYTFTNAPIEI